MNRIKELRKQKGKTLDQMQDETGIKRGTLNNYENGKTEPKLETWQKLADYFDVSVGYLQGVVDNDSEKEIIDEYQKRLIKYLDLIIDSFKERAIEETEINTDLFLAGIEVSKKVTGFTKNVTLMPLKPITEKELKEYIDSQLAPILDSIKNNIHG